MDTKETAAPIGLAVPGNTSRSTYEKHMTSGELYLPAKAPEGAPNILFVLYDDTDLLLDQGLITAKRGNR
jgi:hypothetical protein